MRYLMSFLCKIRTNLFIQYILYVYLTLLRTENVKNYVQMSFQLGFSQVRAGRDVIPGVSPYPASQGINRYIIMGVTPNRVLICTSSKLISVQNTNYSVHLIHSNPFTYGKHTKCIVSAQIQLEGPVVTLLCSPTLPVSRLPTRVWLHVINKLWGRTLQ